jgi:hypothetical protein
MIKIIRFSLLLGLLILIVDSCNEPVINPKQDQPPQTFLTLFPDSIIAPGSTLKTIHWWGDDPDGFVVGFYFSFDSTIPVNQWTYTTKNDSTFLLTMNSTDTVFRFYVAAVDDKGLIDPTPASSLYPTINSPPSMSFVQGLDIPDTIFPVATFAFSASDPDGNNTLKKFYWSLNDTTHFKSFTVSQTVMTLTRDSGLVLNSSNVLYMKVQDNAGAYSPTVRMPRDSTKYFFVKNITSKILVIKDAPVNELNDLNNYLSSAMDTIHFDFLDIKYGSGKYIPKIVNPMFIATLKLFNIVMWFANRNGGGFPDNDPNLNLAQVSLPYYINSGGKVFWSSGFPNISIGQGNLFNFAQIDSIKTTCFIPLLLPNDTTFFWYNNLYPKLFISSNILIANTKGFFPSNGTNIIYKIYPRGNCTNDTINIGFENSAVNPNLMFLLMPIYYLNGNVENSKLFMRQLLINDFHYGSKK